MASAETQTATYRTQPKVEGSALEFRENPLPYVQLVVLHLIKTGEEPGNYITAIRDRATIVLGKEYSIPHTASTIERLATKKLCKASTEQPKTGGKAKRYYHITEKGKIALQNSWEVISTVLKAMDTPIADTYAYR